MIPQTRLRGQPKRRIHGGPFPSTTFHYRDSASNNTSKTQKVKPPRVEKSKAPVVRRSESKECLICATRKSASQSFKRPQGVDLCTHLKNICQSCVGKLLKTKITERQLGANDAILECPFLDCTTTLAPHEIKNIVKPGIFESWDDALFKHYLQANESFIACLNNECGRYFCIDNVEAHHKDCGGMEAQSTTFFSQFVKMIMNVMTVEEDTGSRVTCPYCESALCLKCSRPWHSSKRCDQARVAENKQSESLIKNIGAKPCPNCTIMIQKSDGCDHINCYWCHCHFCWQCMVFYGPDMQHAAYCPNADSTVADLRDF